MSDPKEQHETGELDLDAETVADLELGDDAEGVRGGAAVITMACGAAPSAAPSCACRAH